MRRKLRMGAVAAAAVLALAACDQEVPSPNDVIEDVEEGLGDAVPPVATVDNNFAPSMFSAPAGQEVTVTVRNNGENPHSFTIDALNVDTGTLQSGEEGDVTFTMSEDEVEYYCTVHGAATMSGTITPT